MPGVDTTTLSEIATKRQAESVFATILDQDTFINCTATYTVNGGSRMLDEVRDAMADANLHHLDLNGLNAAAGARIAEMLDVEAAMVTSGASGAIALAGGACVAGTDPELMQAIPDLSAAPRDEFIVDTNLPTGYDPAARLCGAHRVEVSTVDEMKACLARGRTAFVLLMADRYDPSPTWLTLEQVAPLAAAADVPIVVDAAADYPIVPNPYLTKGADLVAYSGGKILRGPQGGGLLLGRSDLILAAAANAAPNHAFGRPLKVGKDISAGMVVAVDALLNRRDVAAEHAEWRAWYDYISDNICVIAGVTTQVGEPVRGGPFPILHVTWQQDLIPLTASEVHDRLLHGQPSIQTHASGSGNTFYIRPVALRPDDYRIVAARLHDVLSSATTTPTVLSDGIEKVSTRSAAVPDRVDVSGAWDVFVAYTAGPPKQHTFVLSQDLQGGLSGIHKGSISEAPIVGVTQGQGVTLRSQLPSPGGPLPYIFTGVLSTAAEGPPRLEGRLKCPAQAATAPTGGAAETSGEARWHAVRCSDSSQPRL